MDWTAEQRTLHSYLLQNTLVTSVNKSSLQQQFSQMEAKAGTRLLFSFPCRLLTPLTGAIT